MTNDTCKYKRQVILKKNGSRDEQLKAEPNETNTEEDKSEIIQLYCKTILSSSYSSDANRDTKSGFSQ